MQPGTPEPRESESETPGPRPRKKPRYLLLALIMTLVFGAMGWADGCSKLSFYRGETEEALPRSWDVQNDADRARAESFYQRYTEAADAAHRIVVPLAAATFVLGAALLALASRALAGNANARSPLIQILIAQMILAVVVFIVTRHVWQAEWAWFWELVRIKQHETLQPEMYESSDQAVSLLEAVAAPALFAMRLLASALVVVALTRQRSRDFFDAAGSTVSGR